MINWNIYIVECLCMIVIFTAMIMIPLCKNPIWWIHDYPKDIQEEYFKTHERIPTEPFSVTVMLKKGFAILLAIACVTGLIILAGAHDFVSGFLGSYGIWFVINWYDCFFLDWVLFANVKCIRLPRTEHMDKAYHQKKYHFVHAIIGMGVGVIPCVICGIIIMLLYESFGFVQ